MQIPPYKHPLRDKEKAYIDRFDIHHDKHMAAIKKEKKTEKRYRLHDREKKIIKEIVEEKKVLKENNIRWRLLNVIS